MPRKQSGKCVIGLKLHGQETQQLNKPDTQSTQPHLSQRYLFGFVFQNIVPNCQDWLTDDLIAKCGDSGQARIYTNTYP